MKQRHTRSNKNKRIRGGGSITDDLIQSLQTEYTAFESPILFDSLDFPKDLIVTLPNLGNPKLQPAFLRRKRYEARFWEDIREHIKSKLTGTPVYKAALLKLQEIIRSMLTIFFEKNILLQQIQKTQNGDKKFASGLLDIENLFVMYKLYREGKLTLSNDNNNDPVKKYYPTIRTCCQFIYIVSKTLTNETPSKPPTNHEIIFQYYEHTFDECIRKRNKVYDLLGGTNDTQKKIILDTFQNYTTCVLDNSTFIKGTSSNKCIPLPKLTEFIEPYTMYETLLTRAMYNTKSFFNNRSAKFNTSNAKLREAALREALKECAKLRELNLREENLKNTKYEYNKNFANKHSKQVEFKAGTNMLYSDNTPLITVDMFGGGISGHTAEIASMLQIFTNSTKENAHIVQQLTAFIVIIWMYDYMHHSLREILLGSTILFTRTRQINDYITKNITYLYSQIGTQTYNEIVAKVKTIIDNVVSISPEDIHGIVVNPLEPMIDFLMSSPDSTKSFNPSIINKLNDCKGAIDTFNIDISTNHPDIYKNIEWPADNECSMSKKIIHATEAYRTIVALQGPTTSGGMRHRKRHITRRIRRSKTPS